MVVVNETQLSYLHGGITWTFNTPYSSPPSVCVGIQLSGLEDSIYPISHKIISVTATYVVIKVYKVTLVNIADLLFSECDDGDVIVHMTAEGE